MFTNSPYFPSLEVEANKIDFPSGDLPLHFAARNGKYVSVEYLVDHGADLNKRDKSGNLVTDAMIIRFQELFDTAFYTSHFNYSNENTHIVNEDILNDFFKALHVLRTHGADFDAKFLNATKYKLTENITLRQFMQQMFFGVALSDDPKKVNYYWEKTLNIIDINERANWAYVQNTPILAWAVRYCNMDTIKCLIEDCGANVKIQDPEGRSLIDIVNERKNVRYSSDTQNEQILLYLRSKLNSSNSISPRISNHLACTFSPNPGQKSLTGEEQQSSFSKENTNRIG